MKMTPGLTILTVTRVDDIQSAFQLFISPPTEDYTGHDQLGVEACISRVMETNGSD